MRTVHARVEIGPDHTLRLQLPEDTPTGEVEVTVAFTDGEAAGDASRLERLAAINAARGALSNVDLSLEEFLQERRDDEERRERALGL